ncbi:MAG: rod shape-determining protein MreC, partial [Clostridia bacterium]|nr:rod shape-determining protein MreC [Clostridia bacterium]
YLKKHGVKVAVIVVIAAIFVLAGSASRDGEAGFVEDTQGSLAAPARTAATAISGWMEGIYGYLYEYDMLVEENNSLRGELAEAQEMAREYEELKAENDRLYALLELKEKRADFQLESCKIVSWDTSNYTSAFTIGKGSDSGIELGDCVITEYGALVGQVCELGSNWATVRTIIDVNMDVGAFVGSNNYAGVISGEFTLMKQGLTRVTYLAGGAQIFNDDEVLTSGKGGAFPSGLLIGTVTTVMTEAGGQSTYGVIDPACDVDALSQVFIVTDYELVE